MEGVNDLIAKQGRLLDIELTWWGLADCSLN